MPAPVMHIGPGDSVTTGTVDGATTASLAVNLSSLTNLAVGDLVVALIHGQNGSTTPTTAPAGWVHVGPAVSSVGRQTNLFYLPILDEAARVGALGVHTFAFAGGASRAAAIVARVTGADLADPIDVAADAWSGSTGAADSRVITGVTTTEADTLVLCFAHRQCSAGQNAAIAGVAPVNVYAAHVTSTGNTVANSGIVLAGRARPAAGHSGDVTVAFAGGSFANFAGAAAAFRPGTFVPPPLTGVEIDVVDNAGALVSAELYYVAAGGELAAPAEVRPVPTGYASITAMLAEDVFHWAHRGGSAVWPEMSMHAYTQAAFWGVGALEISVQRTSDGVFVGAHDPTLDRTSAGATGATISAMTWAQVQAYQINQGIPAGQLARPYMRIEDLFDAYGSSHVLIIDPKNINAAGRTALLDLMDQQPQHLDRLIWKFYGDSSTIAPAARDRGYQTWGYYYEADLPRLAATHSQWTLLGMEHSAPQSAWDQIKALGKPVVGHICTTAAHASAALAKGADGLQVAGVTAVVPRA